MATIMKIFKIGDLVKRKRVFKFDNWPEYTSEEIGIIISKRKTTDTYKSIMGNVKKCNEYKIFLFKKDTRIRGDCNEIELPENDLQTYWNVL